MMHCDCEQNDKGRITKTCKAHAALCDEAHDSAWKDVLAKLRAAVSQWDSRPRSKDEVLSLINQATR